MTIAKVDRAYEQQAIEEFYDETCDRCDASVAAHTGSYWRGPDDLWAAVVGNVFPPPILCPLCFTALAREREISLSWAPCRESV